MKSLGSWKPQSMNKASLYRAGPSSNEYEISTTSETPVDEQSIPLIGKNFSRERTNMKSLGHWKARLRTKHFFYREQLFAGVPS